MNADRETELELLTEGVSLSCVRLEEVLHAPVSEPDAVAAELDDVSTELGKISKKLAQLAATFRDANLRT